MSFAAKPSAIAHAKLHARLERLVLILNRQAAAIVSLHERLKAIEPQDVADAVESLELPVAAVEGE